MVNGPSVKSIGSVTLDAKSAFGVASEVEFVHGSVTGVMTGNAVHGFMVARIGSLVAQRVGELDVAFVAIAADLVRAFLEHGQAIAAVNLVAIAAEPVVGVEVEHLFSLSEFPGMAFLAGLARSSGRQIGLVGGMRIMAVEAETSIFESAEMVMGGEKGFDHRFVAVEAGSPGRTGTVVTFPAVALGERLMSLTAKQFLAVTAMGMMAAQAVDLAQITAQMGPFQSRIRFVAFEADAGRLVFQQSFVIGAMGFMAGVTLSPGERLMGEFEGFFLVLLVAVVTLRTRFFA